MVALNHLALLITSASALVIRDVSDTLRDLRYVDGNTTALTAAANNYNGGTFGAIPIQNAESNLEKAIKAATANANAHAPVTATEANQVIGYINSKLEPDVSDAVTAVINKKSQLTAAGLKNTARSNFVDLKSLTDDYGKALLSKSPSSAQASGQAALNRVDDELDRGVAAFS